MRKLFDSRFDQGSVVPGVVFQPSAIGGAYGTGRAIVGKFPTLVRLICLFYILTLMTIGVFDLTKVRS